jgi:hypothetical protein
MPAVTGERQRQKGQMQHQNTGTHGTNATKLVTVWQHWYRACLCFDAAAAQ